MAIYHGSQAERLALQRDPHVRGADVVLTTYTWWERDSCEADRAWFAARAPWAHESDTDAVGVCLHLIATGAWPTRDGRRQGTPPRAWDRDLWTSLIDAHLHTDPGAGAPSLAFPQLVRHVDPASSAALGR